MSYSDIHSDIPKTIIGDIHNVNHRTTDLTLAIYLLKVLIYCGTNKGSLISGKDCTDSRQADKWAEPYIQTIRRKESKIETAVIPMFAVSSFIQQLLVTSSVYFVLFSTTVSKTATAIAHTLCIGSHHILQMCFAVLLISNMKINVSAQQFGFFIMNFEICLQLLV